MANNNEKTLEQAQEIFLLDTLKSSRTLDRAKPVILIRPSTQYGMLPEKTQSDKEAILAFNVDSPPSMLELNTQLAALKNKDYRFITTDIIFPDGSFSNPMGARALDENGQIYEFANFCQAFTVHSDRAASLTEYTAEAFDKAWDADTVVANRNQNALK